jgi:hypothetical protein
MAYPTESPGIWGWSHAPFLGGEFVGNTIEDADRGGIVGVVHSEYTKSNRGRTYLTASLRGNTIKWSAGFLAQRRQRGDKSTPSALTIGYRPALDAGEQRVETHGNRLEAPRGTRAGAPVHVTAAILNGERMVQRDFTLLPLEPKGAAASAGAERKGTDRR